LEEKIKERLTRIPFRSVPSVEWKVETNNSRPFRSNSRWSAERMLDIWRGERENWSEVKGLSLVWKKEFWFGIWLDKEWMSSSLRNRYSSEQINEMRIFRDASYQYEMKRITRKTANIIRVNSFANRLIWDGVIWFAIFPLDFAVIRPHSTKALLCFHVNCGSSTNVSRWTFRFLLTSHHEIMTSLLTSPQHFSLFLNFKEPGCRRCCKTFTNLSQWIGLSHCWIFCQLRDWKSKQRKNKPN
jgi:hypothetical protein